MTREGILQKFGSHVGEPRVFNDCYLKELAQEGNGNVASL